MRHVLIADDHEVTRRGIRDLLRDAYPDLEFAEVADGSQVLSRIGERAWDLLLLDVLMPGPGVTTVVAGARAAAPRMPILVLTAATEIEYCVQALRAGANGYIHKHRATDELLEAVRRVAAGGVYVHGDTAAEIAIALRAPDQEHPHAKLSPRELEIFRLIARGRAIKEIAGDLGLSDKTVATYLARIREKTGLTSHVEIARYALQHRLVD